MQKTFRIGDAEEHEVGIHLSPFGPETYSVDGKEVLGLRSFSTKGIRRFIAGERERHEIEVRLDLSLRSAWRGECKAELWVDGVFREDLMPPRWRRRIERSRERHLAPFLGTAGILVLLTFLALVLAKALAG